MDPFRGAEYLIRDWIMPNVESAYQDLDTLVRDDDVLVSHPLTYAAPVLAERRGLRWASTILAPLGFFSRKDAPLMAVHPVMETLQRHLPGFYNQLVPLARLATKRGVRRSLPSDKNSAFHVERIRYTAGSSRRT
jgi:hypothetical protein